MKKKLSTIILLTCVILGINAQANLPYETFSSEDFNNTALFPSKKEASWANDDDGRINMPKGSHFTFSWDGVPGNLSFSAKSEKWALSINGKYSLETSSDGGNTWIKVANSINLGENYTNYNFYLGKDVRMIRISSTTTYLIGTSCYIKDLKLTDYDLTVDSVSVKYPEIKALNSSTVSIPVRGRNLSSDLTLELAQNNPNFTLPLTSISKEYVEGEEGTTFDVQFTPGEIGLHKDTLLVKDGTKNIIRIPLEGNAPTYQAYVTIETSLGKFSTEFMKSSEAQKFKISTAYLVSNIAVKAPNHFEVSLDSISFHKTLNLDYNELNEVVDTVIFVRLNTSSVGNFTGNILVENLEAQDSIQEVALEGKVVKSVPILKEAPTVDRNLNWGESLSALKFVGGLVENANGDALNGTYGWVNNGNFIPEIGLNTLPVYFIPEYSYGYETTNCEVNVRVLKRPQTVSWDQEFDDIQVGDAVILTATASSDLPIIYENNNPAIAKIENNKLTALAEGRVKVTATQPGNDYFEVAGGVACYITVLGPTGVNKNILPQTTIRWTDRNSGILSIQSEETMSISVINAQGKVIVPSQKGESTTTIALPTSSSAGLYFVRIGYQNGANEVIKVIK